MLKTSKKQKGITLIALIITIVVLLILSGVTIAQIANNESAQQKAVEAKQKNDVGAELDAIKIAVVSSIAEGELNLKVDVPTLKAGLEGLVEEDGRLRITKDNSPWIVTGKTGMKYKITENGIVTSAEPVASVEFVNTTDSIAVGKAKKLEIITKGASGNVTEANEITFFSGDEDIATVEDDGTIKIVNNDSKIGKTVKISVVADKVEGSNECEITVVNVPKIGDYIEYDVEYNYNTSSNYTTTNGWKILDIPEEANNEGKYEGVKIISTGIPVQLDYRKKSVKSWWGTTGSAGEKAAYGLLNNFELIPFQKSQSQDYANYNVLIVNGENYTDTTTATILKTEKALDIHNLTLQELNIAINKINGKVLGDDGYRKPETCTDTVSNGLFKFGNVSYWLSNVDINDSLKLLRVINTGDIKGNESNGNGLRPVITLKPVSLTWNSTGSYWEVD